MATNSEVKTACEIANCIEFIDRNEALNLDDSAQNLVKEMENHKDKVINLIGKEKYDEELEVLKKLKLQEEKQGSFVSMEGDIDTRSKQLCDIPLA